jgi:hypothetical protein
MTASCETASNSMQAGKLTNDSIPDALPFLRRSSCRSIRALSSQWRGCERAHAPITRPVLINARQWAVLKCTVTPKHASWLNMAEIEISALTKQCLERRLSELEIVQRHVAAWSRERNRQRITIDWTFRRADARRVFPELYRPKLVG